MSKRIIILLSILLISFTETKNDYIIENGKFTDQKKSHFSGILKYNSDSFNPSDYNIEFNNGSNIIPIKELKLEIDLECDSTVHMRITDLSNKRFENNLIPDLKYLEKIKKCNNTKSLSDFGFTFSIEEKETFTFNLKSNDIEILSSKNTNFLYSDFFIALSYHLTSNDIYGFGERMHEFKLGDGKFTLWPNSSIGVHYDPGNGGENSYGIQPIALHKVNNELFLGVIFNNINAQDVYIKTLEEKKVLLEHRTIGGIIDYYFFLGKKPDDVLIKIHNVLGNSPLPPYWSIGFHQARFGYNTTKDLNKVINGYMDFEFPIDCFWTDIDTMDNFHIFTLNYTTFGDLPNTINKLHDNNYHFIPILDIAFPQNDTDLFYRKGHLENAFMLSNYTKKEMVITVWPGKSVLTDFFSTNGTNLWKYGMDEYKKIIDYDGIWLDMNEPELLKEITTNRGEYLEDGNYDPKYNKYEYIPYIPGYRDKERCDIRYGTISENSYSTEYNEKENNHLISYNIKPQIPVIQTKITYEKLLEYNKRPFILTRSNSLGTNKYAFHWLGDNDSSYLKMKNGIEGIFNYQIFGIPMTGDDICGMWGNSYDALCARWMALGAFFPFSRNHNDRFKIPHEPFAFGINSKTFKMSKIALKMRYSLIRYYYSKLFKVSLNEDGSFFKPLFFEFNNDDITYKDYNSSVIIGNDFLLIPIFNDNENDIQSYFPNEDWNEFPNGNKFMIYNKNKIEGEYKNLTGKFDRILLFLRGGRIIPYQNTEKYTIKNTFDLRKIPIELIINPHSENHSANGFLIFDNDDLNTIEEKNYLQIDMNFNHNKMTFKIKNQMKEDYNFGRDIYLSNINFWNMDYLSKEGNYNILKIESRNRKKIYIKVIHLNDEKYFVDVEKYKIRFEQILSFTLEKNNFKFLNIIK